MEGKSLVYRDLNEIMIRVKVTKEEIELKAYFGNMGRPLHLTMDLDPHLKISVMYDSMFNKFQTLMKKGDIIIVNDMPQIR